MTVCEDGQIRVLLFEDKSVAEAYARQEFCRVVKAVVASDARVATLYTAELDAETGAVARRIEEPLCIAMDEDTRGLEQARREPILVGESLFVGRSLVSAGVDGEGARLVAQVRIRDRGRRVEIRDYPPRLRQEDIEHILRAVLWRMAIGEDRAAVAEWDRWVREQAPKPRSWGAGRPLTVSMGEALKARQVS